MELECSVQNYDWGKLGSESKVAMLMSSSNADFVIDEKKPYAELWMGDHKNGPSFIKSSHEPLPQFLQRNPHVLEGASQQLPFLFKVLSIRKALSIQAHPNKEHAKQLHKIMPDHFKDPNHKPELAIALTPFEAMCGFRRIEEIQRFMKDLPELQQVVGVDSAKSLIHKGELQDLMACFEGLMTCPEQKVAENLRGMIARFETLNQEDRSKYSAPLIERLYSQFPDDVGCFAIYFLNIVTLQPQQAIYLGPNVPHAYISGDCIECMACSDNVVRAGLTPKHKEVSILCKMLDYTGDSPDSKIFLPERENGNVDVFRPPVEDFAVAKIEISAREKSFLLPKRCSASILLIIEGSGKIKDIALKSGVVLFLSANQEISIEGIDKDLLIFQAMSNLK